MLRAPRILTGAISDRKRGTAWGGEEQFVGWLVQREALKDVKLNLSARVTNWNHSVRGLIII